MRKTILFLLYFTFILYWTGAVYSNSFNTTEWGNTTKGILLFTWACIMIGGSLFPLISEDSDDHH